MCALTHRKLAVMINLCLYLQATDHGGKSSQTIVEVTVIPGPNTRSPMFQQNVYRVTVSEGAPINSSVATILVNIPFNILFLYGVFTDWWNI